MRPLSVLVTRGPDIDMSTVEELRTRPEALEGRPFRLRRLLGFVICTRSVFARSLVCAAR